MTDPQAAVLTPPATPEPCWLALAAQPESVHQGRRFIHDLIAGHITDPDLTDTAVLLTSELLTNAVRHAAEAKIRTCRIRWHGYHRPVRLGLAATARYVHLLVSDPDPTPPVPGPPADESAESGRGLTIAEALTTALWVTCARYEKTVHALLAAPGVTLTPAEVTAVKGRP